jgi:hypothetical protein
MMHSRAKPANKRRFLGKRVGDGKRGPVPRAVFARQYLGLYIVMRYIITMVACVYIVPRYTLLIAVGVYIYGTSLFLLSLNPR